MYDTGTYTFIADYLPWASGDGMEHRNSTILSSSSSLAQERDGFARHGVSRVFPFAWNVERIRPAALEPFGFEDANMSPDLWFAEGFTSYYTPLFIRRAGITTNADFARAISGGLNAVINSPARDIFNPTEMSMQAPFADRASSSVDPLNFANIFYFLLHLGIGRGIKPGPDVEGQRSIAGWIYAAPLDETRQN